MWFSKRETDTKDDVTAMVEREKSHAQRVKEDREKRIKNHNVVVEDELLQKLCINSEGRLYGFGGFSYDSDKRILRTMRNYAADIKLEQYSFASDDLDVRDLDRAVNEKLKITREDRLRFTNLVHDLKTFKMEITNIEMLEE